MSETATPQQPPESSGSDAWTDLSLTLPIFVVYHLGVVYLPVRNAADPVTTELQALANQSLAMYAGLTLAVGIVFVTVLAMMGQGKAFAPQRFIGVGIEAVAYAVAMRFVGGWALEALPLQAGGETADELLAGPFGAVVMSFGAGFYEELAFRVAMFGAGAWIIKTMEGRGPTGIFLLVGWGVVSALAFSGWHHIGPMADAFDMRVFVYRAACGVVLATIYELRGFAPAVWTHVLYDIWAMT